MSNVAATVEPVRQEFPSAGVASYKPTITTNVVSGVMAVERFKTIGLQINLSSSVGLTASLSIEVSQDGVNFGTYTGSTQAVSADGTFTYNLADFAFKLLRVRLNVSAGSTVAELWIGGKCM